MPVTTTTSLMTAPSPDRICTCTLRNVPGSRLVDVPVGFGPMWAPRSHVTRIVTAAVAVAIATAALVAAPGGAVASRTPDVNLDRALDAFVAAKGGPPGVSVVVQRGASPVLHTAGVADTTTKAPIALDDSMRLASVAKAFSGAAALSLVGDGTLKMDDTIGAKLPDLPAAWAKVTLAQLLQHTGGVPDYSQSKSLQQAVAASLTVAPPPAQLLSYVAQDPLEFTPGTKYHYSNSDNVIVGLMVQAVTGSSYEDALVARVYTPLGLTKTSLPAGVEVPSPFVHAYVVDPPAAPEDVTQAFAAGWAWASGGLLSTPADANRFIRGYASGKTTTPAAQASQFRFRAGSSEPPGPGTNAAGLGIFRYRTRCGVVFGHTGNTAGFTQFIASTRDGTRSVVVSANAQILPKSAPLRFAELRKIYALAVCAALDGA
jgi:D-alanyl-D-alanine carboxypeptidase